MLETILNNSIKKAKLVAVLLAIFGLLVGVPTVSAAGGASSNEVKKALGDAGGGGGGAEGTIKNIIKAALNIFSIIIGVAGVLFIMVAGFKYITAGGDPGKASSAQNTILYAVAGLAVAALAQIIVRFVLGQVAN